MNQRSRKFVAGLLSMSVAMLPTVAVAQGGPNDERVLVRTFESIGAESDLASKLQERIAGILSARPGYQVVTMASIESLLADAMKDDPKCADEACIRAAQDAAESRFMLRGSVGTVGDERVVSVTLIDSVEARPIGGASATFGSDDEALQASEALLGQSFEWPDAPTLQTANFRIPDGKSFKIAVVDLKPLGLDDETAKNLTQILGGALKEIRGADVVSQDDIKAMLELEAQRQALGCSDMSCLAEIGGALGVDKMITGNVGLMGERYVVSMRLVDPRTSAVDARITESFVGTEEQLLPAVRYTGRTLLGAVGDQEGAIAVSANESSASLFLNDEEHGELPHGSAHEFESGALPAAGEQERLLRLAIRRIRRAGPRQSDLGRTRRASARIL